MDRTLNLALVSKALQEKGLNQTSLAGKLGLTKAAVSKWLVGKSFPRPAELLKLGKTLGLAYNEIVQAPSTVSQPLVAFRKRASTKTTEVHIGRAQEMGRLLEPLVNHLPFDRFLSPSRLKDPKIDYDYLQELVIKVRQNLKLDPSRPIQFTDLIGAFKDLQAVLIPVLWGQKQRHENALHIYLPASKTTWIYLNLDSHLHDFKFWMAHELGHVLAVDLLKPDTMEQAEDFSEAFAGALLFPEAAAVPVYEAFYSARTTATRIQVINAAARSYVISPISIYRQVLAYSKAKGLAFDLLPESAFYASVASFNNAHGTVSASLFKGKKPSADDFMRVSRDVFHTPIFNALGAYLKVVPQSVGLLSRMLDIPLTDAKELRQALV